MHDCPVEKTSENLSFEFLHRDRADKIFGELLGATARFPFTHICVDCLTTFSVSTYVYVTFNTKVGNNKIEVVTFPINTYVLFIWPFTLVLDLLNMSSLSYVVRFTSAYVLLLSLIN